MSFYRLFLDDERHPRDVTWVDMPLGPWHIVRDYTAFIDIINRLGVPSFVSFDHDLGPEAYASVGKRDINYSALKEKTGYHCAYWLIEHCLQNDITIPPYQVHSMNPVGVENIRSLMENGIRMQKPTT